MLPSTPYKGPVQLIVSDEDIERVHADANFGSMPKRTVVDEGVLKAAMGYSTGSTQMGILLEHGLVRRPDNRSKSLDLSRKGQNYLRAMVFKIGIAKLLEILATPIPPSSEPENQEGTDHVVSNHESPHRVGSDRPDRDGGLRGSSPSWLVLDEPDDDSPGGRDQDPT